MFCITFMTSYYLQNSIRFNNDFNDITNVEILDSSLPNILYYHVWYQKLRETIMNVINFRNSM